MSNSKLYTKLTEEQFELYVSPYLPYKVSGRKPKIPLYRIYNYIAKVLRTGMQWSELQDCISLNDENKPEIHYTNVWRFYNQWSIFRVFERSYAAILLAAEAHGGLDLSVINGDGTNTVAEKGAKNVAIRATNTK